MVLMPIKTSTLKLRVKNLEFCVVFLRAKQHRVFCFDNGLLVLKAPESLKV